jgi:preprotein translocase subunit SecD
MILVLVVIVTGLVYAAPNLFERGATKDLPNWVPSSQVSLGLDLRGGSYLLLDVGVDKVIAEQMENMVDSVRRGLRGDKILYQGLGVADGAVTFTLRDPDTLQQARNAVASLASGLLIESSDAGVFFIRLDETALRERRSEIIERTVEVVRRRIDETGTREASIRRQGDTRVLVQVPGLENPEQLKRLLGKTAKLTFRFVVENALPDGPIPAGAEVLSSDEQGATGQPRRYVIHKRIMVDGADLIDAQPTFQDGSPVVSFSFNTTGAKRFADATQQNVGKLFAIVLDNEVISAPVIRSPILGGSGIISGDFQTEEVQELALLLRAGALPAPLKVLEERTVGPGLGADSIRAGEIASVLGLVFVVIFMAGTYGLFGGMACMALGVNLVLIAAALSVLQATLTLPGIAGIVLTIGMAVDANVLIFERIREETRSGRGPVTAIDAGYRRALTTIVDSNLTTLIAALLLFQFGTGPIKGFAVTLSIGLVTSMFTAIMFTRLMMVTWLRRKRPQALPV